jgi:N-acetylglucosaminyldiphosphoundecaprenol N-acetyl-beta-D-mannosaminyltransferase
MKRSLFQLPIYTASWQEFWDLLKSRLERKDSKDLLLVFTPNPEQIVQASKNQDFFKILKTGDILLPDGIGLLLANRFIRFRQTARAFLKLSPSKPAMPAKITEKITGVETTDKLLMEAAKKNYVSLIIGGRNYAEFWGKEGGEYEGEMFEDEQSLIQLKKNLYWTEAYQDKEEPLLVEDQALEKILKKIKPQLVFVALGAPDQEKWLVDWRARLEQAGVVVAMAVGGSFDLLFGRIARAPRLFRSLGLEWFWRLLQQPWRWRRQLRLIQYLFLVRQEARRWQKFK